MPEETQAFEILFRGGPLMWPIMACSVVAFGIAVERFIVLRRAAIGSRDFMEAVRQVLRQGRVEDALDALTRMQVLNPEQPALWREAGLMNMRLGRLKNAIDAFEGFVARAPEGPDRQKIAHVVRELRERLH